MKKKTLVTYLIALFLISSADGFITLSTDGDYKYEVFEPSDTIPLPVIEEGLSIYYNTYLTPRLHAGLSLDELHIDAGKYRSYEDFIDQMFREDFFNYSNPDLGKRYYFQARSNSDDKIVGVCAVLCQETPGFYYIEHIGVDSDYKRQGIGLELLEKLKALLTDYQEISLNTRVFNGPAQKLYEKGGFSKLEVHPNPAKQSTYFHYVLYRNHPKTLNSDPY